MIAVDTNLLVYAHRRDSTFHQPASTLMRHLAEGRATWAIPWPCIHEFLAIVTHPRIYAPPSSVDAALAQVTGWLDSPTLVILAEGRDHWQLLSEFLAGSAVTGARVHDARVAALCAAAGVRELWSADRDFSRLPIVVRNPLID